MRTFGIERERFILNGQGKVVPAILKLLPQVHKIAKKEGLPKELFGFELFAGQIEDRTHPCFSVKEVESALTANDKVLTKAASALNLSLNSTEFVEEEEVAEFKVNPFSKRHQEIWDSIPLKRRVAASVVAAVHVHISVNNNEVVKILNLCRGKVLNRLISVGNHSNFKRVKTYQVMTETDGTPPLFSNFSEVIDYITLKGGERNVWDLVRFKPSTGTVEFRMFGATPNVKEVVRYINTCRNIFNI